MCITAENKPYLHKHKLTQQISTFTDIKIAMNNHMYPTLLIINFHRTTTFTCAQVKRCDNFEQKNVVMYIYSKQFYIFYYSQILKRSLLQLNGRNFEKGCPGYELSCCKFVNLSLNSHHLKNLQKKQPEICNIKTDCITFRIIFV